MSVETIEKDVVYEHEEYGEVLVVGISELYGTWNVEDSDGSKVSTTINFCYDFDGFGGLGPSISEDPDTFADSVEKVREHEYQQF